MDEQNDAEVGLVPNDTNHHIRLILTDTALGFPGTIYEAGVTDSNFLAEEETVTEQTDGTYDSAVLSTRANFVDFFFSIQTQQDVASLQLGESAVAMGWQITDQGDGFYVEAELNDVANTGDFYVAVSIAGDDLTLEAQFYNNQDLLELAATDPSWHDVLAEGVQNNYANTGTWYIGAVPDDEPGPPGPTDWNALAAEATARFEATGQWGLLSYDAADREWGIL